MPPSVARFDVDVSGANMQAVRAGRLVQIILDEPRLHARGHGVGVEADRDDACAATCRARRRARPSGRRDSSRHRAAAPARRTCRRPRLPPRRRPHRAGTRRLTARWRTGSHRSSTRWRVYRIEPDLAARARRAARASSSASATPHQRPSHRGVRFSMKAATPSRKSRLPYARRTRSSSILRPSLANDRLTIRRTASRVTCSVIGAFAATRVQSASSSRVERVGLDDVEHEAERARLLRRHQVGREQHGLRARQLRAPRRGARSSPSRGSCRASSRSERRSARQASQTRRSHAVASTSPLPTA